MFRKALVCLLATFAAMAHAPAAEAAPRVVASLKPVHSLVAGVMDGVGEPRLLVAGAASPHVFQMRPSDAKALREAELVVWVGEALEQFLKRPVASLAGDATILTLHEVARMRLLPNREVGVREGGEPEVHEDKHDDHGHDHGEFDMHIWLDPGNSRRIVEVVAEALIRMDPERAGTYRSNAARMHERIDATTKALHDLLTPVKDRPFIVFHDAFQYFERAFGLNGVGAIAIDPTRPPGAKRVAALRQALIERKVGCVFTEPQFEPDLVYSVIEGTGVRTVPLDPLGADVDSGVDAWFNTLRGLGEAFRECLGASRE